MDAKTFVDDTARALATGLDRRRVLQRLAAGSAVLAIGSQGLVADAKKRRRCKPKKAGALCQRTSECCPKKTKRICKQPLDSGNSDKVCCGGEGAKCGGANEDGDNLKPKCCMGFVCNRDFDPDDPNPPFPPNTPGNCVRRQRA